MLPRKLIVCYLSSSVGCLFRSFAHLESGEWCQIKFMLTASAFPVRQSATHTQSGLILAHLDPWLLQPFKKNVCLSVGRDIMVGKK